MSQTIIQKNKAIRAGSIKCEVALTPGAYVDLGALKDVGGIEATGSNAKIEFDNVDPITKFKDGNRFKMVAKLCEINFTNLALINGGQVVTTNIAGALVSGAVQTLVDGTFALQTAIELTGQNANGTAPTINSVTGSVDGALTLGTDYTLTKLGNGNWAIVLASGVTLAQDVEIDTDYTPTASKQTTFSATGIKTKVDMRLTNTDETGKTLVFNFSGVANIVPISIDFPGDTEDAVATMPIELEGVLDLVVDSQQTV